jgi:hypothetical protein
LHRAVWCFTAVVDLAVAGFIVTALVKRAQYFPTRCTHSHGSEPIEKLFAYIALISNEDRGDSHYTYTLDDACQEFAGEWIYVIMIRYVVHCAEFKKHSDPSVAIHG